MCFSVSIIFVSQTKVSIGCSRLHMLHTIYNNKVRTWFMCTVCTQTHTHTLCIWNKNKRWRGKREGRGKRMKNITEQKPYTDCILCLKCMCAHRCGCNIRSIRNYKKLRRIIRKIRRRRRIEKEGRNKIVFYHVKCIKRTILLYIFLSRLHWALNCFQRFDFGCRFRLKSELIDHRF